MATQPRAMGDVVVMCGGGWMGWWAKEGKPPEGGKVEKTRRGHRWRACRPFAGREVRGNRVYQFLSAFSR